MATDQSDHYQLRLSVVLTVPEAVHPHIEAIATGIVFSGPDDGRPAFALRLRGEDDAIPLVLGYQAAMALAVGLIAAASALHTTTAEMPIDE